MNFRPLLQLALVPALALGALALGGCVTKVDRTDVNATKDLSGRWNDADAKLVSAELTDKILANSWADDFKTAHNKKPIVKLSKVIVRTNGETVETDIFLMDIREALINSGKVTVKADTKLARDEQVDQGEGSANGKAMGKELAPDFIIQGTIVVQNDSEGRQSVKYYQVNLQLTDVQSGDIIWTGSKKIRKEVEQAHFGL